jgi:hypothetical protein
MKFVEFCVLSLQYRALSAIINAVSSIDKEKAYSGSYSFSYMGTTQCFVSKKNGALRFYFLY